MNAGDLSEWRHQGASKGFNVDQSLSMMVNEASPVRVFKEHQQM